MIIKGEDQDSIQNTCNTKHNNPPCPHCDPITFKKFKYLPNERINEMEQQINWILELNDHSLGKWPITM